MGTRFLTVIERRYKYRKGECENEPCGVGLEPKVLVWIQGLPSKELWKQMYIFTYVYFQLSTKTVLEQQQLNSNEHT